MAGIDFSDFGGLLVSPAQNTETLSAGEIARQQFYASANRKRMRQLNPYPSTPADVHDLVRVRGNIDVNHRPIVWNDDGSPSTIYSTIAPIDEQGNVWKGEWEKAPSYALVPTIANGRFLTPDGKMPKKGDKQAYQMLEDAAVEQYNKTHEHLGLFASPSDADIYATATHGWMPDGSAEQVYEPRYDGDSNMPLTRNAYEQAIRQSGYKR